MTIRKILKFINCASFKRGEEKDIPICFWKMFDLEFQMIFYSRSPPLLFIQSKRKEIETHWKCTTYDLLFCYVPIVLHFFFDLSLHVFLGKWQEHLCLQSPELPTLPTEIYSHNFWQKFRESDVFTKDMKKELIWRNIFGEGKSFIFPCIDFTKN